ncbi:hypothetical protein CORC01_06641 [Colletotrichum orchidophilum]|uniref:Uncharacterized protein n=1 Tax=Colletotrichum orchidophilum TaxID=1209926 RepID=A0A1G4B9M9_9PEZI|nr:uncharacterized protein CORC01_06641 [Colletotrichum orchidophilum]OHE98127.1 hypothetical protein CORC01_06641 [Colletotrichum orchidophilum]
MLLRHDDPVEPPTVTIPDVAKVFHMLQARNLSATPQPQPQTPTPVAPDPDPQPWPITPGWKPQIGFIWNTPPPPHQQQQQQTEQQQGEEEEQQQQQQNQDQDQDQQSDGPADPELGRRATSTLPEIDLSGIDFPDPDDNSLADTPLPHAHAPPRTPSPPATLAAPSAPPLPEPIFATPATASLTIASAPLVSPAPENLSPVAAVRASPTGVLSEAGE